jgi:CRISPR-associated endonuclease/helicase Cas3
MKFYAHTLEGKPQEHWQKLDDHLAGVARKAHSFSQLFYAGEWGRLAGELHDVGKFSSEFQGYLISSQSPDSHVSEYRGKVDHTSAGAQYVVEKLGILGHLLAYVISGHHAGLLDGRSDGACLNDRLNKKVLEWLHAETTLPSSPELQIPEHLKWAIDHRDAFAVAFFVRMIFSCLTDADFLDTELAVNQEQAQQRPQFPDDILTQMNRCLVEHVAGFVAEDTVVNRKRTEVREACLRAADIEPGLFSLTVPTGGGKTLSSLAFALRHAVRHSLRRIIYVIPFTSIIEQNAKVFRDAFSNLAAEGLPEVVLEHHSNLDAGLETTASRLATENWEVPLVVTTSVQFYESLFANRTSRCRKLHNMAKSVVILDEVQTLPVDKLYPCLRALDELAKGYGASVVLCTATQPAVHHRDEFPIGLSGVREIIPDPPELYTALLRTEVSDLGRLTDAELSGRLSSHPQVLCIVNTRRHARQVYNLLGDPDPSIVHLSALMCPEHRTEVLKSVHQRLENGEPCRVVSTQLIEAGVDIDFPVVYRALAGVDSIAQAAGRCNRNGRLGKGRKGEVYVFRPVDDNAERYFAETAGCGAQVLSLYPSDPLTLDAVEHYFRLYYWQRQDDWDKEGILDSFNLVGTDRKLPFSFDFATVAGKFKIIDSPMKPVIVPWSEAGSALCEELRSSFGKPQVRLLRALQRYTVGVHKSAWERHKDLGDIELVAEHYPVLTCPELLYSETTGLTLDVEQQSFLNG